MEVNRCKYKNGSFLHYFTFNRWCGIPNGLFLFNSLFIITAIIVAAFFYSLTYIKIKMIVRDLRLITMVKNQTGIDKMLDESARNMPIFVLIFLVQWIPYVIYGILELNSLSFWQYNLFVVIITNSGGIWNALAYRKMLLVRNSDAEVTKSSFNSSSSK